jgi:2-amino-4-hydroxy-6-hydroxymethyldihydropteridine diphosphokinase
MSSRSTIAYIAVGSNLGDRQKCISRALGQLGGLAEVKVTRTSSLMENPAVGGPKDSPDFLNGAAEIRTSLEPRALLQRLHEIERALGRERREKWEPRIIDLDLLLYGDQIIATDELTVPHPLMHTRRFVLEPLAQIAPDQVHPILGVTIAKLLQDLEESAPG